ncbi:ATP-binding cassette domain-containing protein [Lysinibacillus xylanilyticus]|uniref:ATP-binding cassette domain-containing protein n=1 Tax=Lysinibacillus xylanilyticus TaxID=582475 RepID=UPI002B24FD00|nr:ATP-binding cassette domain-containing protein [Lysinibacillus xylanilyticus]MEB2301778.1 ATP-binding cassette domain-containing protein [Lysinibacillus xylanilyticus]
MIELKNISKSFSGKTILTNFSLSINKGEFVSIMGESGAGKTTVLNIIGLLDKPEKGTVSIDGHLNPNRKVTMYLRRHKFGYIFQNYVLMNNETVKDNLLISQAYSNNFSNEIMINNLEKVGLDATYLEKKVYQLSGGEQQRIAIARVMLKPCEIILADEPTGNLDVLNKEVILNLFKHLKASGKTIICVTHDKEVAEQSDRIMNIERRE